MAYLTPAVFQGIPALFAPQLPRQRQRQQQQQQRRTATGIMAGRFDPLPALVSDSGRDDASSSSHASVLTAPPPAEHQFAPHPLPQDLLPPPPPARVLARPGRRKNAAAAAAAAARKAALSLPLAKERKPGPGPGPAIKRPSAAASRGPAAFASKGKHVRRAVVPEDKENAMDDDDSDSATSLSPLPSATKAYPAASTTTTSTASTTTTTKPKASGFWRARSTNTPEGSSAPTAAASAPAPATAAAASNTKRKRSSLFDDSSSSPLALSVQRLAKKPRLAAAIAAAPASPHAATTPTTTTTTAAAGHLLSPSLESLTSLDAESAEVPPPKKKSVQFPKKASTARKARKPLTKFQILKQQLKALRATESPFDPPSLFVPSVPIRKRAKRKNTAPRKGWKGWVEEELEPQKLILLDKPEVLPERTTRSGRKID